MNKTLAIAEISARLKYRDKKQNQHQVNEVRRNQIGSGMRGDKVRTIRTQDGTVKCDLTGKTMPLHLYLKGEMF